MYVKNNGTYFSLNKWIFCTIAYSSLYCQLKGMFSNYFKAGSDN
jgi:hypothetical protein